MISIDTNILLFAINADCAEHAAARAFLEECAHRDDVAIAELVLVELYVLLRNPAVVKTPLSAPAAVAVCEALRSRPRWARIETAAVMDRVWQKAREARAARRRIFDARLAFTLIHNGVKELATDNVRDFRDLGIERVWNPIRGA